MNKILLILCLVFCSSSFSGASDILSSLKQRRSHIDALLLKQKAVECTDRYLHLASNKQMSGPIKRLMTLENLKSKKVYRSIGLEVTPIMDAAEVGKARGQLMR